MHTNEAYTDPDSRIRARSLVYVGDEARPRRVVARVRNILILERDIKVMIYKVRYAGSLSPDIPRRHDAACSGSINSTKA